MQYKKWLYIYPPRPVLYTPKMLSSFNEGHIAQLKLNGSRCLVVVHPDGRVKMWNRHGNEHSYSIHKDIKKDLLSVTERGCFTIFDAELLHNKHPKFRDTLYLYDIFVFQGKYLYNVSYSKRYKILRTIFNWPTKMHKENLGFLFSEKILIAKNYKCTGLQKMFIRRIKHPIVEGFVIKKKKSKLDYHYHSDKCSWMGKIRRPHKNYRF